MDSGRTATVPPVFVVGSPRSGTTLFYHMLVSSGLYADYRSETKLYVLWFARYGDMRRRRQRQAFLEAWLPSSYFQSTGLDPERMRRAILDDCRGTGDIVRTFLSGVAERQGVPGWADCTPDHGFYMERIAREIPDARFIHMIRDGRDVALSLQRLGWVHLLPWDRRRELLVAGWTWRWLVADTRRRGHRLGTRYLEVRFEDLLDDPDRELARVSRCLGVTLDPERIRREARGTLARPNTAFGDGDHFSPVGRWRVQLDEEQQRVLTAHLGDMLAACGYETPMPLPRLAPSEAVRRNLYTGYRRVRQWLKMNLPLAGQFVNTRLSGD